MKKIILLFLGVTMMALITHAQSVEDELGFKYVKAKYLMDTERYEDAIKAFTAIIKDKAEFEEALLFRADAKYKIAAYKGTKKDVLEYISYNGITDKALILLGKADYKLKNNEAALNSLLTATGSAYADGQVYEYIGNLYQNDGKLLKACDFWAEGADLGSNKCETKSRKVCGSTRPSKKEPVDTSKKEEESKTDGGLGSNNEDDVLSSGERHTEETDMKGNKSDDVKSGNEEGKKEEEAEEKEEVVVVDDGQPKNDDTPNDIEIDEELNIIIYGNELGKRRVLDKPNILMLSDDVGEVAIDICVNRRGKVESAEFNDELSTIKKQSLVTLAIRKAKDFWFEKSDYKEQCGVMIFNKKAMD